MLIWDMYKHLYRYTDELLQPGPICNSEKDRGEKKIYIYIYANNKNENDK